MLGNLQNPTSLTLKRSTDDDPDTLMLQKLHEYQCNVFNCFYAEHQLDSEIVRAVENEWSSIGENRRAFSHTDPVKDEYSSSATSLLDFEIASSSCDNHSE